MIPNPVPVKIRSMRSGNQWILAAHLPAHVNRADKNADKVLEMALKHAASLWKEGDRPRRWEGRPAIVGFGLVWYMPDDYEPNKIMGSVEFPDAGSDLYPAMTYDVNWKIGKVH